MFLSGGVDRFGRQRSDYFASRNCVRELSTAVELGLEVIFVHEPEAGCSFETHLSVCPTRLRPTLEGGLIVPWYRTEQFQRISLLMITRRIHSAGAELPKERRIDNFHDANDVTRRPIKRKELELPRTKGGAEELSFHLYISDRNPEAQELLADLQKMVDRCARGQKLLVTNNPTHLHDANSVRHFLLLLSLPVVDGLDAEAALAKPHSKDARTDGLLAEVRMAMANGVHLVIVHDMRDLFPWVLTPTIAFRGQPLSAASPSAELKDPDDSSRGSAVRAVRAVQSATSGVRSIVSGVGDLFARMGSKLAGGSFVSLADEDGSPELNLLQERSDASGEPKGAFAPPPVQLYVPFDVVYNRMPKNLIEAGIFSEVALQLMGCSRNDAYRRASVRLILGAVLRRPPERGTPMLIALLAAKRVARLWRVQFARRASVADSSWSSKPLMQKSMKSKREQRVSLITRAPPPGAFAPEKGGDALATAQTRRYATRILRGPGGKAVVKLFARSAMPCVEPTDDVADSARSAIRNSLGSIFGVPSGALDDQDERVARVSLAATKVSAEV